MNNPFEVIETKLSNIEDLLLDLKHQPTKVEPTETTEQLLTIDEIAKILHLTKPTIYSKHSRGEIPGVCKRNKRLYFQKQVIIDWIKEGRVKSDAEIEDEAQKFLIKKKGGRYE